MQVSNGGHLWTQADNLPCGDLATVGQEDGRRHEDELILPAKQQCLA